MAKYINEQGHGRYRCDQCSKEDLLSLKYTLAAKRPAKSKGSFLREDFCFVGLCDECISKGNDALATLIFG